MRIMGLLLCTAALAVADAEKDAHLDELQMGTYWYGAPVGFKDLQGKVVLVEYWGS